MHRVLLIARPEQRSAVYVPPAGREGEDQSLGKKLRTTMSPFGSQGTPAHFPGPSLPVPHPRRGKKTQLSLASERTTLASRRETISPCFSSVKVTLRANTMKDRTITVRGT